MHIYSAKIKLGGLLTNEIRKSGLTAAEILVLRRIHGDDALSEIIQVGTVNRSDSKERQRLFGSVGDTTPLYREDQFREVFQNDFGPLPQVLPEAQGDDEEEEEMDLTDEEVIPVDVQIAKNTEMPAALKKYNANRAAKKLAEEALA